MAIKPSARYALSYQDQALWERGDLSIEGVRAALTRRDPRLAEYIVKLTQLDPAMDEEEANKHKKAFKYQDLVSELSPWRFSSSLSSRAIAQGVSFEPGEMKRGEVREIIAGLHRELWQKVEETPEALPDRLKLGALLMEMWESEDTFSREALVEAMSELPLKYGPWRAMKQIFKESAARQDWVMFGVIAARLDREGGRLPKRVNRITPRAPFNVPYSYDNRDVSRATVEYLLRRAWRVLRGVASDQPSLYPEVAAQVLKHYRREDSQWELSGSWLRNHILFHESKRYGAESFSYSPRQDFGEHAYPELWARSERPLLQLFGAANNERVLNFTTEALLKDFKPALTQLEAGWVSRIAAQHNALKDRFLHRWYTELCPHAQRDYAKQGLHEPLLALLWSERSEMSEYALNYFKAHPDALLSLVSLDNALAFARSSVEALRELGQSLLEPKAGHFTLTLEQWTSLLHDERSFEFASQHVKALFSGKDFSYEWYSELINSELSALSAWSVTLLKDSAYQPLEGDLCTFYWSLLTPEEWRGSGAEVALKGLEEQTSDQESAPRLLNQLSVVQLRALLLHPESGGRDALKRWAKSEWFAPRSLGARWLRDLLDRDVWREGGWREGLGEGEGEDRVEEGEAWRDSLDYPDDAASLAESWLLTPQLFSTEEVGAWWLLQRGLDNSWSMRAYQNYVKQRFTLAYFVALDVKDEESMPESPSAQEGFGSILSALDAPKRDWSVRQLLRSLIRERTPAFVAAADPNAPKLAQAVAISDELLSFDVFSQLASSPDEDNRALARDLGVYHYQRWTAEAPLSFDALLPFFAKGHADVQDHLLKAMSASPLSADARIDVRLPQFDPDGLYAFCFSAKATVRDLGLSLIGEHPERFADPARISLLAESSDRRVCEGVVKLLWGTLRFRPATAEWKPYPQSVVPQSAVAQRQAEVLSVAPPAGKTPDQLKGKRYIGAGAVTRSDVAFLSQEWIAEFLTRTLFRLSPTHPLKSDLGRLTEATAAWRNKVSLIKALRDLAVRDVEFAGLIKPILEEFMRSRGHSERAACLVALTRMRSAHPGLFAAQRAE